MCGNAKNSLSELVLTAVFFGQQKNGVSAMQITSYVADKRRCDPCKLQTTIKTVLKMAKEQGIICESRGLFRLESKYEDELDKCDMKALRNTKGNKEKDKRDEDRNRRNGNGNGNGNGDMICDDDDDEDEDDDEDDICGEDEMDGPQPKKMKSSSSGKTGNGNGKNGNAKNGNGKNGNGKNGNGDKCEDDDEDEEWAKCVEQKVWKLAKTK